MFGGGRNLVLSESKTARKYLEKAYAELQSAEEYGYPAEQLAASRQQVFDGLNILYDVTTIRPIVVSTWTTDDMGDTVLGPDDAAYVINSTSNTVYRVNLETGAKLIVAREGDYTTVGQYLIGAPRVLTVGGPDVLILDSLNSIFTWRPAQGDKTGRGVLKKASIPDNVTWGLGVRAIGTFVINDKQGLYNLYVVVPTAQQILKYQPAQDGTGYPKESKSKYLSVDQNVSTIDDMYVDGKIFLIDRGQLVRYDRGQISKGWTPDPPIDTIIRPLPPVYTRLTADTPAQDKGNFYAFDSQNRRIVALKKSDGSVVATYVAPLGTPWLTSIQGMFVVPETVTTSATTSAVLYWTEGSSLMMAYLDPSLAPVQTPSPSPVATKSVPSLSPTPKK